jgi:predicted alpha/beta superfamily hydrolase
VQHNDVLSRHTDDTDLFSILPITYTKYLATMKRSLHVLLILGITCMALIARGQDTVLNMHPHGILDSLHSPILNQERMIQVFLPSDYKPGSADKYDVLYVLDGGNWNTGLVWQVQNFAQGQGFAPKMIIVSVMGIDRNVELTPTRLASWKGSGGAEKFLSFIKNELIPYVNSHYPTNGDNTLWGHSLSGMFAVYALLNEPQLFKSCIAVDPSFWWDNSYVPKMAATKLSAWTGRNMTLFIAGRDGSLTDMKIDTMDAILKKAAPVDLKWKLEVYHDETHSSVRLKSTYDGLKFTYDGLGHHMEFHPMTGIVLKDKPFPIFFFDDTSKIHYTLNGSAPTSLSPNPSREMVVNGPATVIFKSFCNRSRYDQTATGTFSTEKMPRPLKEGNWKSGGFNYAYYEGDWDQWPDLKNLKPSKIGVTGKDFDLDKFPRKNNYALLIDGFLEAKEDGYYLFDLQADKGSKLYVGNKLLITWAGNYDKRDYSCIVPLSKGFYPFRIEYLHKNPDFKLNWVYVTPSRIAAKSPIPIPVELQYGRK